MKERGILFKDKMIRQILTGHKTVTRRLHSLGVSRGDRLYVKEAYFVPAIMDAEIVLYRSDFNGKNEPRWHNPMFMPKKYARIWLEITATRKEPLQQINYLDAVLEGAPIDPPENDPRDKFRQLWDSINKHPGTRWEDNPIVHVYEFKAVKHQPECDRGILTV